YIIDDWFTTSLLFSECSLTLFVMNGSKSHPKIRLVWKCLQMPFPICVFVIHVVVISLTGILFIYLYIYIYIHFIYIYIRCFHKDIRRKSGDEVEIDICIDCAATKSTILNNRIKKCDLIFTQSIKRSQIISTYEYVIIFIFNIY